ncbi:DUF4423 domain-containing protein [Aeromicrobium sp. CnD17-E]|uniref:DUF4423 domain-containing protein n=1 Tax=Aeromicrobium sp. CnD17-E TaxID=2954487 RepID=UPI0020969A47|nr:DUF4423 domain-containing protein [Aeromicrobium sp. CnD17-E]MCO7238405.1 DUF4423 domain-containing protein [Aeromicrobium sp. CnD17-E]
MTEPLHDTWHARDLPVLRTTVALMDGNTRPPGYQEIAGEAHVSEDETRAALLNLHRAGLIEATISNDFEDAGVLWVTNVSREALTLSGQWPSPETIADRLLITLQELAEHGSDPVEKAKARKALDALGGFSRDLLVSVAGAAAGVAMQ